MTDELLEYTRACSCAICVGTTALCGALIQAPVWALLMVAILISFGPLVLVKVLTIGISGLLKAVYIPMRAPAPGPFRYAVVLGFGAHMFLTYKDAQVDGLVFCRCICFTFLACCIYPLLFLSRCAYQGLEVLCSVPRLAAVWVRLLARIGPVCATLIIYGLLSCTVMLGIGYRILAEGGLASLMLAAAATVRYLLLLRCAVCQMALF